MIQKFPTVFRKTTTILALFLITNVFSVHGWNQQESYIRRFVGQWKGVYTISTLFGKNLGTYTMEQSYYWLDGHLLGATAIQLPDGKVQYEYSEVWSDGAVLRSIVESETVKREYYGWMSTRTVWWQSHYDTNASFHQLHTEKLEPTHKGFQLTMDGYQWTANTDTPDFLHVRAELIRLKEGEEFELMETIEE